MRLGPAARLFAGACLALLVLLAVMSTRALLEARAALARAEQSLARGDVNRGISELRLAARWDAPFNVYARDAFGALERIAAHAESAGELERALAAYRAIHASAYAARAASPRDPAQLARVAARIAELMVRTSAAAGDPTSPAEGTTLAEQYRAALSVQRPLPLALLAAWLGLVTWVLAAVVWLLRGMDADGHAVPKVARPSAVCVALGWVVFALGLRFA